MKKSVTTAALAAILVSAGSLAAFDCDKRGYGPGQGMGMMKERGAGCGSGYGHGRMILGAVYDLDLSDKQREEIEKLAVEHRYAMKPLIKDRRKQFAATISEKGFDKAAFIKMEKERAANRSAVKADHIDKVVALLNEDQRDELKEKIEEGEFGPRGCKSRR